jgi:hypothetical protein
MNVSAQFHAPSATSSQINSPGCRWEEEDEWASASSACGGKEKIHPYLEPNSGLINPCLVTLRICLKDHSHFLLNPHSCILYNHYIYVHIYMVSCWTYFFDSEDGGDMLFRNVSWHSTDYTTLYPRRWHSPLVILYHTTRYISEDR